MATDLERLVVSLEASITKYERAMQKAVGQSEATAKRIERRWAKLDIGESLGRKLGALGRGAVGGLAAGLGVGLTVDSFERLIDASTRVQNALKVAGLEGGELTRVYDSLFASAQRNAAPLESLVTLYGRASLVQKELGVSTEELLGFTDKVALSLRVSGQSAAESSGALLQLGQALGSGTVRAEEFNSILEGALPIAQAAAAGLTEAGGSVAKLRQLVVDGKVSSQAFFRAFEAGAGVLEDKVAGSELTVSQGFVRLQNVLIDTAGKFDEATGASKLMGSGLSRLADAVNAVGQAFEDNQKPIRDFLGLLGQVISVLPVTQAITGGPAAGAVATARALVARRNANNAAIFPGWAGRLTGSGAPVQPVSLADFPVGGGGGSGSGQSAAPIRETTSAVREQSAAVDDLGDAWMDVRDVSRDALSTFIDDLRQGKPAADALADSLSKLSDRLLDMALNTALDAIFPGAGGLFGGLLGGLFGGGPGVGRGATGAATYGGGGVYGIPGRAAGGPVSPGHAYLVGERGPELFAPSMPGRIIPNGARGAGPDYIRVAASIEVRNGNLVPVITEVSGQVAGRLVKSYDAALPARQAEKQARFG